MHLASGITLYYNIGAYRILVLLGELFRHVMHMLIRAGDRGRVCAYVCTPQEISKDNVSHQPSVKYFQQSLLFHILYHRYLLFQHPGRSAVERRIRQEVKSESYFPGRFFLVSFLLDPPPPRPSSIFSPLFSLFFSLSFAFFPSAVSPLYPPHPQRDGITRQNCRMQTCKLQS